MVPDEDKFDRWCTRRDPRIRALAYSLYVNPYLGSKPLAVVGFPHHHPAGRLRAGLWQTE
jgi:hypothetical protein